MTRLEKARRQISRVSYRVTESGCHIPTGRTPNFHGYINTNFELKQTKLHRLVAFVYLGLNLDDELELALHKSECNNRACFNKEHLYIGDHKQNMLDTLSAEHHSNQKKDLCPRGHVYDKIKINRRTHRKSRRCSQCRKILKT